MTPKPAEHTPTPWVLLDDAFAKIGEPNDDVGCTVIADCEGNVRDLSHETMIANAAFIVRAVNAHEELVKALEESLKLQSHYAGLLNSYDSGERLTFSTVEQWLNRLNAIAKASA